MWNFNTCFKKTPKKNGTSRTDLSTGVPQPSKIGKFGYESCRCHQSRKVEHSDFDPTCDVISDLRPLGQTLHHIWKVHVGEGHLFATLPDLRPPPLQGNWWGTKVQITCQNVGHIRFVRSNPFPSSPVSGGLNQVMEQEKCNFLTWNAYFHR